MEYRVWIEFFEDHKIEKYANKNISEDRGALISDYQTYLEKKWVDELQQKYSVKINEVEKKRILELKFN